MSKLLVTGVQFDAEDVTAVRVLLPAATASTALKLVSPADYSLQPLVVGGLVYSDRAAAPRHYVWNSVPTGVYTQVLGKNSQKQTASITVEYTGKLYIGVPETHTNPPIQGATLNGMVLQATHMRYLVYEVTAAGAVTIPAYCTSDGCNQPVVFAAHTDITDPHTKVRELVAAMESALERDKT